MVFYDSRGHSDSSLSGDKGWHAAGRPSGWPSSPDGEKFQADEVERFYTMVFSHPATEALTWWDFSDRRAWQGAPAGFLRTDLSPKPAYDRLLGLIKNKWWTRRTEVTEKNGTIRFRGFLGDYQVSVAVDVDYLDYPSPRRANAAPRQPTSPPRWAYNAIPRLVVDRIVFIV